MPSAAQFIRKHKDEIVRRWFGEASLAASSRGVEGPELTNILPTYISSLGEAGAELGAFSAERRSHLERHVASRIRQGFSVEEVVDEILLVGRCAERVSEAEVRLDERPDRAGMERLREELNRAAAAATSMFAKHIAEGEREEKDYAGRLRDLASASLREGAVPLRSRLPDALELIKEGVGAASATLLLYRANSNDLVNAASVGVELMDDDVTALDLSSFAGQVASSPEATALDVTTSKLTIPPALRRAGIASLLGVRLPAYHLLTGVLYVGLRERRRFTAREAYRLEALGEQLTLHLDNAALFAALQQRVDSLRSERELRERFVSALAHDLRGPLSAAKMATDMLVRPRERGASETVEERRRDLLTRIDRNIDRAERMVRDLLDANRIHAGERLALRLEECDLVVIARETIEELTESHGERFVLTGEDRVLGVWAADELRRSLWNLTVNALKYGAAGRPITINVATAGEDRAVLSVHNEGLPIPADEQELLFRPFARARAAEGGAPRGWGLGLTLVRGSAEAHGGRVSVRSDAATGTTFTLDLPLDARPYQPRSDPRGPEATPPG